MSVSPSRAQPRAHRERKNREIDSVCTCVWVLACVHQIVWVCLWLHGCVCGVHSVYVWPRCGVCASCFSVLCCVGVSSSACESGVGLRLLFCARGRRRFRCIYVHTYPHVYLNQCWHLYLLNLSCTCGCVSVYQVSVCRGVRVHTRLSVNFFQASVSVSVHVNVLVNVHVYVYVGFCMYIFVYVDVCVLCV